MPLAIFVDIGLLSYANMFRHLFWLKAGTTGFSSHSGTKLRDWAIRQAVAGCYSWAAMSSNDSKTRYSKYRVKHQDGKRLLLT